MSYALRRIKKTRWYGTDRLSWLPTNHFQADALQDLKTEDNKLSVYVISDDRNNLKRVIAAMAANCDTLSHFDFFLVDQNILKALGIKYENVPGDLKDEIVNKWHQDLVNLSAQQIFKIGNAVKDPSNRDRIPWQNVRDYLVESIKMDWVSLDQLSASIKRKVQPYLI